MAYQFSDDEMKLIRDALIVYNDQCFGYFKSAVTERQKQEVYELSMKLETLSDRLEAQAL